VEHSSLPLPQLERSAARLTQLLGDKGVVRGSPCSGSEAGEHDAGESVCGGGHWEWCGSGEDVRLFFETNQEAEEWGREGRKTCGEEEGGQWIWGEGWGG
jgi:hypothetical protein